MVTTTHAVSESPGSSPHHSSALLELSGIHKTYFMDGVDVRALRGVDLQIQKGELVAIMGASGSGKSTMMNILGCLDRPTRGTYRIGGEDVSKFDRDQLAAVRNRRIGFVFQGFNLLSRTSALENVELPMIYAGIPTQERQVRAMEALAAVSLQGREHHFSNQLSGGQQQRVAIARSLVNQPAMILADEPTGNLDSRSSIEIMSIFQGLNRKGITVIIITHEHDIADFTNRKILLRDGLIMNDQQNEHPNDAARALAALPPPRDLEPAEDLE